MMIDTIQVEIEKFCTKRNMELYVALALSTSHLTNEDTEQLNEFSESLACYISQIVRYITNNSDTKPYPFTDWPLPK